MMKWLVFIFVLISSNIALRVFNENFYQGGSKVFLSGMNLAWFENGIDFGENNYHTRTKTSLLSYLDAVKNSGGNSVRVFLHNKGEYTPEFDTNGFATATDSRNTMKQDLASFLESASSRNIVVFLTLWEGAARPTDRVLDLFSSVDKLQAYIDKVLRPLVKYLQNRPALGGWDIINAPEGLVYNNLNDQNSCFNTEHLKYSGAGWVGTQITMRKILTFVNLQIDAIKSVDESMLTTVAAWSHQSCSDNFGYTNHYKDSCLLAAGGKPAGLDFITIGSFAVEAGNTFNRYSLLKQQKNAFGIDKPVVVGLLSERSGDGSSIQSYMKHAYTQMYSGAWTWQANGSGERSDNLQKQQEALQELRGLYNQNQGGLVNFSVPSGPPISK